MMFPPARLPPIETTLSSAVQQRKKLKALHALQIALLPGYAAAVVSSVFNGPCKGLEKEFEELGRLGDVKVQIIWVSIR